MATVNLGIPEWIAAGLANGTYERVGGVIRYAADKRVAAWLRETKPHVANITNVMAPGALLNLSLATTGFAVVLHRLYAIEQRIRAAQAVLRQLNFKIDILFFANFQAALDLAANAFTMKGFENRKASAMQAINRLSEARHHYAALADAALDEKSQVVDEYLAALALAYVSEALCYLELDEVDAAYRTLQHGSATLRGRAERYVSTLLTPNPAVFLHPALQEVVDLRRLTKVLQWLKPDLDENAVFEEQRANLFELARNPQAWIKALPPAVWDARIDDKNNWRRGWQQLTGSSEGENRVLERLPGIMGLIEATIEDANRFQGHEIEVQAILQSGMTFRDWQKLNSDNQPYLIYVSN